MLQKLPEMCNTAMSKYKCINEEC